MYNNNSISPTFVLNRLTLAIAASLSSLSAASALAVETAPRLGAERLDTLVVTAHREAEQQHQLPVSIGVVSAQQITLDQGAHIQDSTRLVAGVTINQLSGSSSHNTGIRMPLNHEGYYLFLQDGIPLQSPAFFNHNGLRWSSYHTNVQQIEVLKGAGGSLQGSGAVAATVNLVSDEVLFRSQGQVSVALGEHGYQQTKLQHNAVLNDQQAVLVAASALRDEGWRDNTGRERQELLVKHLWEISEQDEVKTQLQLSSMRDEMASALSETDYLTRPENSGLSPQALAQRPVRTSDFARVSLEWTHQLSEEVRFSLIPYYRYSTNDYMATWHSYTPTTDSEVRTIGVLSKGQFQHANGADTQIGLDLEQSDARNLSDQPFSVSVTGFSGKVTHYTEGFQYRDAVIRFSSISPYVQHTHPLSEALRLSAAIRYDLSRFELDNHLSATDNDGYGNRQLQDRTDRFSSLNPKLGLTYQLSADQSLYGRLAQANRLPTATQLYDLSSGDSRSLVGGLTPETATTYELGYRYGGEGLSVSTALYRMDIEESIVVAYDDNGDSYRTNAGKVRHQGLELELDYQPHPQWQMALALSRSQHQYLAYQNAGRDYSGNQQKFGPEVKGAASLLWQSGRQGQPSVQLQVEYFGAYWMDDDNSQKADAYTLAHLKAQFSPLPTLKLFGRIDNLMDTTYASQAEISYGKAKYSPGEGRSLKLGAQLSW